MSAACAFVNRSFQSWFPHDIAMSARLGKRRHDDTADAEPAYWPDNPSKRLRMQCAPARSVVPRARVQSAGKRAQNEEITTDSFVKGFDRLHIRGTKRERDAGENEADQEIVAVDLQPLAKRNRMELQDSSMPICGERVDDATGADAVCSSTCLALVRYRNPSKPEEEYPSTLEVHELLNDRLTASRSWESFPSFGLGDTDGQVVLYTGGKWLPPIESAKEEEVTSGNAVEESCTLMDVC